MCLLMYYSAIITGLVKTLENGLRLPCRAKFYRQGDEPALMVAQITITKDYEASHTNNFFPTPRHQSESLHAIAACTSLSAYIEVHTAHNGPLAAQAR